MSSMVRTMRLAAPAPDPASEAAPAAVARASATATSTVVSAARASPSQAATTASMASSSASASSSARPRNTNVRRLSALSGRRRHSDERLKSGGFTSKNGFSVVAPISTTSPSSTAGNRTSCCALLKRCTSSMKSIVPWPCSPSRCCADARASRTSFTPAAVAESVTRCLEVVAANRRANVVLPVPSGPHRIAEQTRSASASARSAAPCPTRCSRPNTSSSERGRSRAANGACRSIWRLAASAKRLMTVVSHP